MIKYLEMNEKAAMLKLALQVEHLFGNMVGVNEFESAVEECLKSQTVIGYIENKKVFGAGIIDKERNEIAWLVVDSNKRGMGIGQRIMDRIMVELDSTRL